MEFDCVLSDGEQEEDIDYAQERRIAANFRSSRHEDTGGTASVPVPIIVNNRPSTTIWTQMDMNNMLAINSSETPFMDGVIVEEFAGDVESCWETILGQEIGGVINGNKEWGPIGCLASFQKGTHSPGFVGIPNLISKGEGDYARSLPQEHKAGQEANYRGPRDEVVSNTKSNF